MPGWRKRAIAILAAALWSHMALAEVGSGAGRALVMPLTGLADGEVRQCGIRLVSAGDENGVVVDIALERQGPEAVFAVRAVNSGMPRAGAITDMRFDGITFPDAATVAAVPAGAGLEWRFPGGTAQVTEIIRGVMLHGVTVSVRRAAGEERRIEIAGPLPQSVRAAYLNCAGDLYRPGE